MSATCYADLDAAGLNLQAVFELAELPDELRAGLPEPQDCPPATRLLLVGHGGRNLWSAVTAAAQGGSDPIDDFSVATVDRWFRVNFPRHRYQLLYPCSGYVALQDFGRLAGWHHPSPFMVGINNSWGTWFAYRVALLTDAPLEPTARQDGVVPCERCVSKPCIAACPAGAAAADTFALDRCVTYRQQPESDCAWRCLARLACPVGAEHRYDQAQMRHTYAISLQAIQRYARGCEHAHGLAGSGRQSSLLR